MRTPDVLLILLVRSREKSFVAVVVINVCGTTELECTGESVLVITNPRVHVATRTRQITGILYRSTK